MSGTFGTSGSEERSTNSSSSTSPDASMKAGAVDVAAGMSGSESKVPPSLIRAFQIPKVIQVLADDEGFISAIELVREAAPEENGGRAGLSNEPKTQKSDDLLEYRCYVHLFIGTSNGTVIVCNALKGTILAVAQFQYHHDFSHRGEPSHTAEAVSEGVPDGKRTRHAPARNQGVLRFAVHVNTSHLQRNPSISGNARPWNVGGQGAVVGVYVVHDGGKVALLARDALDIFVSVSLQRLDGQRPHFLVDWQPSSSSSAFPVAGPAAHFSRCVEFLYTLQKMDDYPSSEKEKDEALGLQSCYVDAAFFVTNDALSLDALLTNGPKPVGALVLGGQCPAFSIYPLCNHALTFSPSRTVKAITSIVTSVAMSLWSGARHRAPPTKSPPPHLEKKPQRLRSAFVQAESCFTRVLVDPTQQWAAFYFKGAGRIYLADVQTGVIWRTIKGCREAQCQWWFPAVLGKPMLLLVVYLPLRSVVEVHSLRLRRRIAACHVSGHSMLLRPSCGDSAGAPMFLSPNTELRRLCLDVSTWENEVQASTSKVTRRVSRLGPHVHMLGSAAKEALRACRTPYDFYRLAVETPLPRFPPLPPGAATRIDFTLDSFHKYRYHMGAICDAVKRRFAPGLADLYTVRQRSSGGPDEEDEESLRDMTASYCFNYLQLRAAVVDGYSRIVRCSVSPEDDSLHTLGGQKMAKLWHLPLHPDTTATRKYLQAAASNVAELLPPRTSEAAFVKTRLLPAWQRACGETAVPSSSSACGEEDIMSLPMFLSLFRCREPKLRLCRERIVAEEDERNVDTYGRIGLLLYGREDRGLRVFVKQLDTVAGIGISATDMACATIAWVASMSGRGACAFATQNSLGALCFAMQTFSDEAFITGIERAFIPFLTNDGTVRQTNALLSLLLCLLVRHAEKPVGSARRDRYVAAIRRLVKLFCITQMWQQENPFRDIPLHKSGDSRSLIGMRLVYIMADVESSPQDTLEEFILRHTAGDAVYDVLRSISWTESHEVLSEIRFELELLPTLYAVVVDSRSGTPLPGSFFVRSCPWVEEGVWQSKQFNDDILCRLGRVRESLNTAKMDEGARLFWQNALAMTAMSVLQQLSSPFAEVRFPFWDHCNVADGNLFASCAEGTPGFRWLVGSRSTRDYLQSMSTLCDLTMSVLEAVMSDDADDAVCVSIVQCVSRCLSYDYICMLPRIPRVLWRRLHLWMHVLAQYPLSLFRRTRSLHSMLQLLLFFMDLPTQHVEAHRIGGMDKLMVPWTKLFGAPEEYLVLIPPDLDRGLRSYGVDDGDVERKSIKAASVLLRSFLADCLLAGKCFSSGVLDESIIALTQSPDTYALLQRLATILGLLRHVPEFPSVAILDFAIKNMGGKEEVEQMIVRVSDRQLVARVAACNLRGFLYCCVRYATSMKTERAQQHDHEGVHTTSFAIHRVLAAMSEQCRHWVQGAGSVVDVAESTLALEAVGGTDWVTASELGAMEQVVKQCLSPSGQKPCERESFLDLLYVLARCAKEGSTGLCGEAKGIASELPHVAHALRKYM